MDKFTAFPKQYLDRDKLAALPKQYFDRDKLTALPKQYFDRFRFSQSAPYVDNEKTATNNDLVSLFDGLAEALKLKTTSIHQICQELFDISDEKLTDVLLLDHQLYALLLPNTLSELLEKWYSKTPLTDDESDLFGETSKLLLKLIQGSNDEQDKIDKIRTWLLNETFIGAICSCVQEIAKTGTYLSDHNLEHLNTLLEALTSFQDRRKSIMDNSAMLLLLESVVACLTSSYYTDTFLVLRPEATMLTKSEAFLLITCVDYLKSYDGQRKMELSEKLLQTMIEKYIKIYDHFLPSIEQWKHSLTRSIYCMTHLISYHDKNLNGCEEKLVHNLSQILNSTNLFRNISSIGINSETLLIEAALRILNELTLNPTTLAMVREKQLNDTIIKFTKVENDEITLKACQLLGSIMSEDEFKQTVDLVKVTEVAINNLKDALNSPSGENREKVLSNLKKNDDIKNEIINQNALGSIIKSSTDKADDATPLQILYSISFNGNAVDQLKNDENFIEHVREQEKSDNVDVQIAAKGIMWKLVGEAKFITEQEEKETAHLIQSQESNTIEVDKSSLKPDDRRTSIDESEKYDMMISYSWNEKELIYKIHERLVKDGYKIWLDLDNMYGSIILRMAEAIENSDFILMSMSSAYKKSPNCQAEAEYAYNRKRRIIPLITEANYRANGWLGFIAGSKMYVDFQQGDFDSAYNLLIKEIKRNQGKSVPPKERSKPPVEEIKEKKAVGETVPARVVEDQEHVGASKGNMEGMRTSSQNLWIEVDLPQTRGYVDIEDVKNWSEQNVLEFLNDFKLGEMASLCHSMDGCSLIELYEACVSSSESMYKILNTQFVEVNRRTLPIAVYFKFIGKLKQYLRKKSNEKPCTIF
ncbi:unnamed protein product [Didymodactylos carnosus]|uniref:TIR domain-containing protein n=1 Tax=Didymodactylos carnosus TaxID=1234261 RepID=A0A815BCQ8_9BILA|nr:unnamed protein product [Didymodactylos carnosus]CAF4048740.1 unnamed protein product [Didymodactylos carnosus]